MMTSSPKQLLRDLNLKPKHHFGQNFLCHPDLSEKSPNASYRDNEGPWSK